MSKSLVATALVAIVAATSYYFLRAPAMDDPSKHPPREIQISLGQTVRDFIQTNGLPIETGHVSTPDRDNYGVAVDVIADTSPIIFGDHWISLLARIGSRQYRLPPGRTLFIDQVAGRINSFSLTPYATAQPLAQTNRLVQPVLNMFLQDGWAPQVPNSVTFALSDDDADFKLGGEKIYAQLQDGQGNLLEITVTNLASVPSQPAYILAPSPPRPTHVPPVYVIRLGLYWAHSDDLSYGDLIYPRRLFVNGDKNKLLRLRPWVEDPGWTPQAHGMVDLGGSGENKRWSVPAR